MGRRSNHETTRRIPLKQRLLLDQPLTKLILLANPDEPDDKERKKKEQEENQVKDRRKESIDVVICWISWRVSAS